MKKLIIATFVAISSLLFSDSCAFAAEAGNNSAAELAATAQKKKKETKVLKLSADIHCESCAKKVKENISYEKGVKDLEVSVEKRSVVITYDPAKTDPVKLLAAMRKIGFPATIVE